MLDQTGFKKTEVGLIPVDWDVKKLGQLFEITSSKRVFKSEWKSDGIPFYRARELAVLAEKGEVDNELFIEEKMYEEYAATYGVPKVGDLLVTGVGTLGEVYVISDNNAFYFKDGNIIWLRNSGEINPIFLSQLYKTPLVTRQIEEGSAGTTVGTYTITAAENTLIPYPPLHEQNQIARVLSDADALLRALDEYIAKKQAINKAAMQQLLTGRTRLPGFNERWEKIRLGEIGNCLRGVSYDPEEHLSENDKATTARLLRANNISHSRLNRDDLQFVDQSVVNSEQIMKNNDVLLCMANGNKELVGKAARFSPDDRHRYTFGAFMGCFRTESDGVDSVFVSYLFHTKEFFDHVQSELTGSSINNLRPADVAAAEFKIPNYEEQRAIARVLLDMDEEIELLNLQAAKLRKVKKGMMQQLLTGRIRLVEADESGVAA